VQQGRDLKIRVVSQGSRDPRGLTCSKDPKVHIRPSFLMSGETSTRTQRFRRSFERVNALPEMHRTTPLSTCSLRDGQLRERPGAGSGAGMATAARTQKLQQIQGADMAR
jgi:hypothetical protein